MCGSAWSTRAAARFSVIHPLAGAVDDRTWMLPFRDGVVNVTAVRTRYEHIAAGWRRATAERRAGLLGELELLALQLPAVQAPMTRTAPRSWRCGRPSGS